MENLISRKIAELREQSAFYRTHRQWEHAAQCDRVANQWEKEKKEMRA